MCRALFLALLLALLLAAPASARVITRTSPIHGAILATALSGDGIVVARRPARGPVRIERYRPGARPRLLLRAAPPVPAKGEGASGGNEIVTLAASAQAVAVGIVFDDEDIGPSRTYVGTPAGPLREVDACARNLIPRAVAADGDVAAWSQGGCGKPRNRLSVGPSAIVSGPVEPGATLDRVDAPAGSIVGGLALRDGRGVASLLQPRFFGFASELRHFGPGELGDAFQTEEFGQLSPTGILDDGTLALERSGYSGFEEDEEDSRRCGSAAAEVVPPGTSARRVINVGGCLHRSDGDELFGPAGSQAAGARLVSLVDLASGKRQSYDYDDDGRPTAVTSVRPGTRGVTRILTGTYRSPRAVATDGTRIAFAAPRCDGDQDVTVVSGPDGHLRSCVLRVRTRRARVRAGRIRLRVACRQGCRSRVYDETSCGFGRIATFEIARGARRVSIPVPRGARRLGRLIVRIDTENGPSRRVEIRLR